MSVAGTLPGVGGGLGTLHRAWRALPAGPRRAAVRHVTGWLAPRPERPAPAVRPGIAVAGELGRASGLGEGARLYLAGAAALGLPCWEAGRARAVPPGVPLVLHLNAAALPAAMLALGRDVLRGRRVVGVWPWEMTVPPPGWCAGFDYVHEVWAPSRFSAEAVAGAAPAGFPPVRVVPYPVASGDAPVVPARPDWAEGAVLTVVAFSVASSVARKNPAGAIAAHRAAFGDRADRQLLVRAPGGEAFPGEMAALHEAAAGLGNVRFDTRVLERGAARALLAGGDIVLSLHRSEGFGLVPAEAMLLGRAVVATDWSGTADFLDAGCGVPVPYALVPARDPRGVFQAAGAVWAEPDVDAAAAALARLADDAAERARLGAAARAQVLRLLGPEALGQAVRGLATG